MERKERLANNIREMSAQFLERASNKTSLITVTDVHVSPNYKNATIFITVLPDTKENAALNFVKRNLGDLRDFLKDNLSIKIIPYLEVKIDSGEKNRQKIDELLRNG